MKYLQINTTELTSKELKKELTTLDNAMNGANKSAWKIADVCKTIVQSENYVDDFGSLKKLGEAINLASTTISKYSRCCEYLEKLVLLYDEVTNFTVGQVIEMLTIDKEELGELVEETGINDKMTCAIIRECVKDYKEQHAEPKEIKETEETEETEEAGEETEEAGEEAEVKNYDNILHLSLNGQEYDVDNVHAIAEIMDVLKKYE